jgi:hypothetical protein
MSKHWDYEDDHDWDDDVDYAAKGYVYWYGKYYRKEDIDALFKDNTIDSEVESVASNPLGWILLTLAGLCGAGYGIKKKVIPYINKKKEETKKNREDKK